MRNLSQPTPRSRVELTGERAWFSNARFGLFVHFGLYVLHGGNENDVTRGIMSRTRYERLLRRFNPRRFRAAEWAALAADNGARYVVFTAKHGEGFCLWDSRHTAFKITNTSFRRDLLGELAMACRRRGLRFGVYYSFLDLHYHEPGEGTPESVTYPGYVEAQLRELLTQYGRIDAVWFDPPDARLTAGFVTRLSDWIHQTQPGCVLNDRGLGHPVQTNPRADFVTTERFIPEVSAPPRRMIECCDAMGQLSWGYHRRQQFWSAPELIRRLSRVAAFGGNYLLNVEPAPSGAIRPECVARLRAIGRWLRVNGEAVYDVMPCALTPREGFPTVLHDLRVLDRLPAIGVATRRGEVLYLHLHSWPSGDSLLVPHVRGRARNAELLEARARLSARVGPVLRLGVACNMAGKYGQTGLVIGGLPPEPSGAGVAIVKVRLVSGWQVQAAAIRHERHPVVKVSPREPTDLWPDTAECRATDGAPLLHHFVGDDGLRRFCWFGGPGQRIVWRLQIPRPGRYEFRVESEQLAGAGLWVKAGRQHVTHTFAATERRLGCHRLGRINLVTGRQTIEVGLLELPGNTYFPFIRRFVLRPWRSVVG